MIKTTLLYREIEKLYFSDSCTERCEMRITVWIICKEGVVREKIVLILAEECKRAPRCCLMPKAASPVINTVTNLIIDLGGFYEDFSEVYAN